MRSNPRADHLKESIMQPIIPHALAALSAFAIASFAANALATIQRTFVASTGVDTNACSITAPCRDLRPPSRKPAPTAT
jgi:hypothetical protein